MRTLESLAKYSSDVAMHAAVDALRARKITAPDYERVTVAIKSRIVDALSEALADAREAIKAGMSKAAEATWIASFRLAGINAVGDVYPK